jgi:hypothetical protein
MKEGFFSKKRRKFIADAFREIGTAVVISLVIGEFVSNEPFSYQRFLIGLGSAIVFYAFGTIVTPKE